MESMLRVMACCRRIGFTRESPQSYSSTDSVQCLPQTYDRGTRKQSSGFQAVHVILWKRQLRSLDPDLKTTHEQNDLFRKLALEFQLRSIEIGGNRQFKSKGKAQCGQRKNEENLNVQSYDTLSVMTTKHEESSRMISPGSNRVDLHW